MTLSVLIPVYRNEASIPELIVRLQALASAVQGEFEAVLVVDASPDRSFDLLMESLPKAGFRSQLLALSRNFGSFSAIRAAMEAAAGDIFAVMAADLQEPPDLILRFRELLMTGRYDVVVGTRLTRRESLTRRLTSGLFWWLYRLLIQREVPPGGVDVFACNRQFRDCLLSLPEKNTSLVGLIFWLGFRRAEVPYIRLQRKHGNSAWSLRRRFKYFLDSALAFSDLPIKLMETTGLLGMFLAIVLGAVVIWAKLTGRIPVPGYAATVLAIMFFGGLNSFSIGLLGEYVWRSFENTKGRPDYIVAFHKKFDPGAQYEQQG
ncbi:MAG: glycosyltransferase family 2 protein [Candidatus Hadarchaeum sp.]